MEQPRKILIIEDDKFLIKLYSEKLTREGFHVSMAISGEEGLTKIADEKPDLILLDVILPQKNGFDILSEVKQNSATKHIPVIMLTNLGQDADVKTGKELGAADYLVKTDFSINDLPERIRHILGTKSK